MKWRSNIIAMTLWLANSHVVQAEYSAILEQEWSIAKDGNGQKFETLFEPQWNISLSENIEMTFIGQIRFDALDELGASDRQLENYSEINGSLFSGDHISGNIREWFIDTEIAGTFWRIGKQQVVWGQADGLKVLDVINPQSYREFILDDFDDSRIPLWMLNVEVPIGDDDSLQLLWIPDLSYNEFAVTGGVYQLTSPLLVPQLPTELTLAGYNLGKPSSIIKDSDVGLRYSKFYQGWDLTFNYLYHYLDSPISYQYVDKDTVVINAKYERSHLLGGTASKAFGDFTLRAEIGYSSDSFHLIDNSSEGFIVKQGVHSSADISSVIGLDWQGLTDAMVSVQWFQSTLLDNEPELVRPQNDHSFSFMYTQSFENEVWEFETLILHSLEQDDGSIQSKLNYMLESNIKLWISTDVFYGSKSGLFGQFKDTKRVNIGVEWGF